MKKVLFLLLVMASVTSFVPAFAWERALGDSRNSRDRAKSFELYAWKEDLLGDVSVKGMQLDLQSEADFSAKTRFGGNFCFPLTRRTNVTLAFNSFEHSGNITKAVTFDNRVYKLGASMRLETRWWDITGSWEINRYERGYWDLLYGVKFCHAELDLSGYNNVTNTFQSGSWSESFPIPYIGIGGGAKLSDAAWIDGHIKFISANAGGANAKSYDLDLNLAFQLNHSKKRGQEMEWYAALGFRKFVIDGDFDNDSAKIGFSGPTFGIVGRFF